MNKLTSTLLYSLTGAAAIASLPSCKANKEAEAPKKMNIIYIMSDDHSYQTISAYDQRYIHTPNIDRIGNDISGITFYLYSFSIHLDESRIVVIALSR